MQHPTINKLRKVLSRWKLLTQQGWYPHIYCIFCSSLSRLFLLVFSLIKLHKDFNYKQNEYLFIIVSNINTTLFIKVLQRTSCDYLFWFQIALPLNWPSSSFSLWVFLLRTHHYRCSCPSRLHPQRNLITFHSLISNGWRIRYLRFPPLWHLCVSWQKCWYRKT